MRNIVFISATVPGLDFYSQQDCNSLLRNELLNLGLEFHGVKINGQFYFMVVTHLLAPMKKLAKKLKQDAIFVSDNKRSLYKIKVEDFSSNKLGHLRRVCKDDVNTEFVMILQEDGVSYYYSV